LFFFFGNNPDNLFITSLWPQVGPIAGGTNITITGKDFPSPDADVIIGSIGNCITLNVYVHC
jgi:hypothetical protein